MSSFTVMTPTLAAAAVTIQATAADVRSAGAAASSVGAQEGAFGSEPIGAAFAGMCARARQATGELEHTLEMLSRNVAAAAVGYLVTDQGIVAMSAMPGFKA